MVEGRICWYYLALFAYAMIDIFPFFSISKEGERGIQIHTKIVIFFSSETRKKNSFADLQSEKKPNRKHWKINSETIYFNIEMKLCIQNVYIWFSLSF